MLKKWIPLLRNRDFVLALAGRSFSAFGDELALIALTLRVQGHGAPPYAVALLFAAGSIPFVALAGWAGRLADRADTRTILLTATLSATALSIPLIVVHSVEAIVGLIALLGTATAVSQATWSALTPRIVGETEIGRAASLVQSAFAGALLAAPAIAGLLTARFGSGTPLLVDAISFGVLALATAAVRTRRVSQPSAAEDPRRGGVGVIRGDPVLVALIGTLAVFILLASMSNIVIVFLVRITLHAGPAWYGFIETAWGLGLTVGSLGAGLLQGTRARARLAMLGAASIGAATLGYGWSPAASLLVPFALLGGVGNGLLNALVSAVVATRVPDSSRGRAFATVNAITNGTGVGSLAVGGVVTSMLTPRDVMWLTGSLGLMVGVLGVTGVERAFHQIRVASGPDVSTNQP